MLSYINLEQKALAEQLELPIYLYLDLKDLEHV